MTLSAEEKKEMMMRKELLKKEEGGEWKVRGCMADDWYSSVQTPTHFDHYVKFWGQHVEAPEAAQCVPFIDYYQDILGTTKKSHSQLAAEGVYHVATPLDDEWILDFKGNKIRRTTNPEFFAWLLHRRQLSLGQPEEPVMTIRTSPRRLTFRELRYEGLIGMEGEDRWVLNPSTLNKLFFSTTPKAFYYYLAYWRSNRHDGIRPFSDIQVLPDGTKVKGAEQLIVEGKLNNQGEVVDFNGVWLQRDQNPIHYAWYLNFWKHDLYNDVEQIPFVHVEDGLLTMEELEYQGVHSHRSVDGGRHPWVKDLRGNNVYRDDDPDQYAHLVASRRADLTSSARRFPTAKRPANMLDFSAKSGNSDRKSELADVPITRERTADEMREMGVLGGEGRYMWVMDCGHRRIVLYKAPNHFHFYVDWWRTHGVADQCQPYREYYEAEDPSPFGVKRMLHLKTTQQMEVDGLYDFDEDSNESFVYDGELKKMISFKRFPNHARFWYNHWSRDVENTGQMPAVVWRDQSPFTGIATPEQLEYDGKLKIVGNDRQILDRDGKAVSEHDHPEEFATFFKYWATPAHERDRPKPPLDNPFGLITFEHPPNNNDNDDDFGTSFFVNAAGGSTPTFGSKAASFKTLLKDKAACMEFLLEHHRFGTDAAGQRWVSARAFGHKYYETIQPTIFHRILKEQLRQCRNERVYFGKAVPYEQWEEEEEQRREMIEQRRQMIEEQAVTERLPSPPPPLNEEDRAFLQAEGEGENALETGWWHDWSEEEEGDVPPPRRTMTDEHRAMYDAALRKPKEKDEKNILPLKETPPAEGEKMEKTKKMKKRMAKTAYSARMRATFGEVPRPTKYNEETGEEEQEITTIEEEEEEETLEETLLNTEFFEEATEEESEIMEDFVAVLQHEEAETAMAHSRNLGFLRSWGVLGRDASGEYVYNCTRERQIHRNEFPRHYAYYEQHWLRNLRINRTTGNFTVDERTPCPSFVDTEVNDQGRSVKTFAQIEFEGHAGRTHFGGLSAGQRMNLNAGLNLLNYVQDFNGQNIPTIPQFYHHTKAYADAWKDMDGVVPHVPYIDVDQNGQKTDIQLVIEGFIEASFENGRLHFFGIKEPSSKDGRPFMFWLMPAAFLERVKDFWRTHDVAQENDAMMDTVQTEEDGQTLRSFEQLQHDHNARLFDYAGNGGKILKKQWVKTETGVLNYNEDGSNEAEFDEYVVRWQRQLNMKDFLMPSTKRRLLDTGRTHFNALSGKHSSLKRVESEESSEEEIEQELVLDRRTVELANAARRGREAQLYIRSLYAPRHEPVRFVEGGDYDDSPSRHDHSIENRVARPQWEPYLIPNSSDDHRSFYNDSYVTEGSTMFNWWGTGNANGSYFGRKLPYEEKEWRHEHVENSEEGQEMSEGQLQRFQHMMDHALMGSDAEGRAWVLDCNAEHPNKIFEDERPHLFNYYLRYWTDEANEHVTMEQCIERIDQSTADNADGTLSRSLVALEHEYKHGTVQVHENGADFTDNWIVNFKGHRIRSFPFSNHYEYYLQFWKTHPGDTNTSKEAPYVDVTTDEDGKTIKTFEQLQMEGKANLVIRTSSLLSEAQRTVLFWVLDFNNSRIYMSGLGEDDAFYHYVTFWQRDMYHSSRRIPYAPEGISRQTLLEKGIMGVNRQGHNWVLSLDGSMVFEHQLEAHYKFYLEQWLSGSGLHEKKNFVQLRQIKLDDGTVATVKTLEQLQFERKMSMPSREIQRMDEKWVLDFNGDEIDIWPYPAHYSFYLNYWRMDINNNPDRPAPFVDKIAKPDGTYMKTVQQLQLEGLVQLFRHDMSLVNDPSFNIVNARLTKREWVRDFHGHKLFFEDITSKEFDYYVDFYANDMDGVNPRIDYPHKRRRLENGDAEFSLKLKTPHLPLEIRKSISKRKGRYNMDTPRTGEELEEWGVAGIDILKDEPIFWVLDHQGNRVERNDNVKLYNRMLRYWSDRDNPIVVGKGSPAEYTTDENGEKIKTIAQLAREHKHSAEGEGRVWVASFTPVRIYLNYAPRHYYFYRSFWQHDVDDNKPQVPFVDIVDGVKSIQQLEYEDKAFHVLLPDPEEEVLFPGRELMEMDWVRDFNGRKIFADVDPERFSFYLDFWKHDLHNNTPQIAPSEYTTFNGKLSSDDDVGDDTTRLVRFGFMGVNHHGQPWVRDNDDHILLKEVFPEHFVHYAKRDPFGSCESFKKFSQPGVKSLVQLEVEGRYKDDGFMERWVVDEHGERIHAHRDSVAFEAGLLHAAFEAKMKRVRPTFLESIGYKFVGMLGFGSEAITVKVRKLNLIGDEPEYYAAKMTGKGTWGEINKIEAIHANDELSPFLVEVYGIYNYPDHSPIEEILGDRAWEKIYEKNDTVERYYPYSHRSNLSGGIIIMSLMEGSMELDDGKGLLIFKKSVYLQQFRDWIEKAWTVAWENNFIHGDLHLRNILFRRVTRGHAEFKMADFSESTFPAPNNEETENKIDAEWRDLQSEIPDDYTISIASNLQDPEWEYIPWSDSESEEEKSEEENSDQTTFNAKAEKSLDDNDNEELTENEKQFIQQNLPRIQQQPSLKADYLAKMSDAVANAEAILTYVINAWIFDSMKIVDRGRYAVPIYSWVAMVAGYDVWQLNRLQFDKRRQAVLDEAVRRNVHGDKSWLVNLLVSVDKLDDTNIYTALHLSKPKVKVYDPSMDSKVVMFKRINPLASKATVGAILKKFTGLKEEKKAAYEKKFASKGAAEEKQAKEADSLRRISEKLQVKQKEFEDRESVFEKRREDLMKITDVNQRLAERRRIEKDEERLQYEKELIAIERKSTIQRIQEIKPMPEVYHKPSKVINFIRDVSRPMALKLNKMGPDWRDIMTLLGKVPIDKMLDLTYLRKKFFKMIFGAVGLGQDSPLYASLNGLISHVWFVLEPIIDFANWSTKHMLSLLKTINESKMVKWIEMYYADWVNLYISVFHNVYGVVPEFFIILYSNFFQIWYHLYLWGNKTLFSNIKRIL